MIIAGKIHLPFLTYGVDTDKNIGHGPGIGKWQ
jgi:hypothetical protein